MRPTLRRVALAFVALVGLSGPAEADMAPPGQFIQNGPALLPVPDGKYRTRLGWLMASMIVSDNQSMFAKPLLGAQVPQLFEQAFRTEMTYLGGLQGPEYYRYADGMVRDIVRLQILTLSNDQESLALTKIPISLLADVSATALNKGFHFIVPAVRKGIQAIESRYLAQATEQEILSRMAFDDLQHRYASVLGPAYQATVEQSIAKNVTAAELRDLFSESVISTGVGQMIDAYRTSPERLLELVRKQMVMDLAAYGCACVLDVGTHLPREGIVAALGPTDAYRTGLGYLLSIQLTPPQMSISNVLAGPQAKAFLDGELANLQAMRAADPLQYNSYLRSLLVDLDQLEDAQIKALQKGMARSLIEGTVLNILFGSLGLGAGNAVQVAAMLANAGYASIDHYSQLTDELQIRAQMAMLRETVLDQLLPGAETCGCGAGVGVAPSQIIQGKPPAKN